MSAIEKLQQSHLSDQSELLADDLSIDSLYLWQDGVQTNADIAPLLIGNPTVERTIDGASSVRLPVTDIGRKLLNSGLISKRCDIEIDGLWFRLVQVGLPNFASVELVFEDREVAVLREYPKPDAPHNGFRVWDPTKVSRLQVAHWLVSEPGREHALDIGFIAPGYGLGEPAGKTHTGRGDRKAKQQRAPGFGPNPDVTVKGVKATKAQLDVIDTILQVGVQLKARRKVLVAAIMTATAESGCGSDVGHDPRAVGVFQQNPDYWAATGDVATDAGKQPGRAGKKPGFFSAAVANDAFAPGLSLPELCHQVQRNAGGAATYAPWRDEAEKTVTIWAGDSGTKLRSTVTPETHDPVFGRTGGHPFTRGRKQAVNGKAVYVREDNWACLQRLAKEVGWRCFCVSGSVYFATDEDLIRSAPIHTLTESLDWVDEITGELAENLKPRRSAFVVKRAYAQMSVKCRIGRWQAPPGTCVEVAELGPFDGRWIVSDVQRPLLNNNGTITIKKPQPALPEALSPELRQSRVQVFVPSGSTGDVGYVDAGAIVAAANKALINRDDYRYRQDRPMPASLFGKPVPKYIDCSAFATLVYQAGKMPDPNDLNYNGSGNTETLWENGRPTSKPQPGDLVFWTSDPSRVPVAGSSSHVAVYIGAGEYIACQASSPCIVKAKVSTPLGIPMVGYRTYRQPAPGKGKR